MDDLNRLDRDRRYARITESDTLLQRWRALAELENARARKTWGFAGAAGWSGAAPTPAPVG